MGLRQVLMLISIYLIFPTASWVEDGTTWTGTYGSYTFTVIDNGDISVSGMSAGLLATHVIDRAHNIAITLLD